MKKKQADSSPDPVLRRAAIASDVEAFLKRGNKIEQIQAGVSAQVNPVAKKPAAQVPAAQVKETSESTKSDGDTPQAGEEAKE